MKTILRGLADILFPPACVVCDKILETDLHYSFCPGCFSEVRFISHPLCPRCGLPYFAETESDHLCGDCLSRKQYFTSVRSLGVYDTSLLKAIQRFKYHGSLHAGEALGSLMAALSHQAFDVGQYDVLMPVPLHLRRLRERGFNQSLVLARAVARRFSVELDFMSLRRTASTAPQTGLKKEERTANVRGAFKLEEGHRVKGKKVLLVDDVYTTGSTVRECARILMRGGAGGVGVLTLARAL